MELLSAFRAAPIYAIYDTRQRASVSCADAMAAWALAGIRVLQYRHKGEFDRQRIAECEQAAQLARASGVLLIVNDRADVALLTGAAGVHVGQEDLAPADVRKLLPGAALVGHSTHNPAQLAASLEMPVDYVAAGPVFATGSKVNADPVVGTGFIRQARAMTRLPLVAIGGITGENLAAVLREGADAVALIGGMMSGCATPAQMETRARDLLNRAVMARA